MSWSVHVAACFDVVFLEACPRTLAALLTGTFPSMPCTFGQWAWTTVWDTVSRGSDRLHNERRGPNLWLQVHATNYDPAMRHGTTTTVVLHHNALCRALTVGLGLLLGTVMYELKRTLCSKAFKQPLGFRERVCNYRSRFPELISLCSTSAPRNWGLEKLISECTECALCNKQTPFSSVCLLSSVTYTRAGFLSSSLCWRKGVVNITKAKRFIWANFVRGHKDKCY